MTGKPEKQFSVKFLPDDINVKANRGESIFKVALKAGVHLNTTCGGSGTCGSCRIIIKEGQLDYTKSDVVPEDELERGVRLACQSYVKKDVAVEVIQISNTTRGKPAISPSLDSPESTLGLNPIARKLVLKMTAPTPRDNRADLKRIKHSLKNQGFDEVLIDFDVLKQVPEVTREQNWVITATLINTPPIPLLSKLESGDTSAENYGVVFDLGTTAVRGRMVDLNSGKVLAEETAYNRQREYGEDVISRVSYCRKPGGIKTLQGLATDTLNTLIESMILSTGVKTEDINSIVIAGNTVMVQLLLAINPEPLRLSPYVPAIDSIPPVKASELGINLGKHCYLHIIPVVASYVGGDIVAGVAACGMHNSEETILYIDIGTNGEIVLGSKEWMITAACSAGPTFEGGGIRHGMLAIPGAIEEFEIPDPSEPPVVKVIGSKSPAGICGSGLINTISALFSAGLLDRNGKFNITSNCPRLRRGDDGFEYVIAEGRFTASGKDIVLTEVDVDNFIRSKAAIYAGCQTLAESIGVETYEIDKIIIAGTFGSHIDIENAIKVGLLPDIARDKFQFIGNGSLVGAHASIISREMYLHILKIAEMITGIELSENGAFMDNYVASLFLPHTDLDRFPSVKT